MAGTPVGLGDRLELRHQPMVLVVEHVAVDDVLAGVVAEVAGDQEGLAGVDQERLLEARSQGGGGLPLRLSMYQSVE